MVSFLSIEAKMVVEGRECCAGRFIPSECTPSLIQGDISELAGS